jgi:hypothetical protein
VRVFGWQTRKRNESELWWDTFAPSTGLDIFDRSEYEHTCWDPKDGELCLNRVKPEETLVEARKGSDVQIDLLIWV